MFSRLTFVPFLVVLFLTLFGCKKNITDEKRAITPVGHSKKIVYEVHGSKFRLNYIDSNSVFQKDQVYDSIFHYEFWKGSGASIGITIHKNSPGDTIFSWELYINDKLYANAFSEGGVYLIVPYD